MEYKPSNPSWCYTYVDVPNLEMIKKELLLVLEMDQPITPTFYVNRFVKDFIQVTPYLNAYLKNMGVLDKFYRALFSSPSKIVVPIRGKLTKIHVDAYDKHGEYSLNIPLVDCLNSYTCWYTAPVQPYNPNSDKILNLSNFALCDDTQAIEICRVETIRPMIMNTTIPHRALTEKSTRVLACLRFQPELTYEELARFGVFPNDPKL